MRKALLCQITAQGLKTSRKSFINKVKNTKSDFPILKSREAIQLYITVTQTDKSFDAMFSWCSDMIWILNHTADQFKSSLWSDEEFIFLPNDNELVSEASQFPQTTECCTKTLIKQKVSCSNKTRRRDQSDGQRDGWRTGGPAAAPTGGYLLLSVLSLFSFIRVAWKEAAGPLFS